MTRHLPPTSVPAQAPDGPASLHPELDPDPEPDRELNHEPELDPDPELDPELDPDHEAYVDVDAALELDRVLDDELELGGGAPQLLAHSQTSWPFTSSHQHMIVIGFEQYG